MLLCFKVKNFRGFDELRLNLEARKYSFNENCISNEVVKTALVYGKNGTGKSNLGYALLDIINHITDNKTDSKYDNYLNKCTNDKVASFEYTFKFNENVVKYSYSKDGERVILSENLTVNDVLCLKYEKCSESNAIVNLKGAESLNTDLSRTNISVVKYVNANTILVDDAINKVFKEFIDFVNGMSFYKYFENVFEHVGMGYSQKITEYVTKNNALKEYQKYLNDGGVDCELALIDSPTGDKPYIAFKFEYGFLPFFKHASSGTKALSLLFITLKGLDKRRFLFIDEFDAFYHTSLSDRAIELLIESDIQVIASTHNTGNMTNEYFRPDCLFEIENSKITAFHELTEKELRKAHNIEKLYRAGAFNAQ